MTKVEPDEHCGTESQSLPERADVVIIGAGIMGCAAAYYLAKAGIKALVLDKSRIAGQQSTRAWGFVRQQSRDPVELPLAKASLAIWSGLEQELQSDLQWRQGGALFAAASEKELAGYEAWMEVARQHELDTRMLTDRELQQQIPGLELHTLGGIMTPSDGHAEPRFAAPAFARRARELGASFIEGWGVTGVELAGGRVVGVRTERGLVRTNTAICVAGVTSYRVLRSLGITLPQHQVRGTVARTSSGPAASAAAFIGGGLGWRQRIDGSFNIAQEAEVDVDITLGHLRGLQWYLGSLLPHLKEFSFHLNGELVRDLLQRLPGSEASREGALIHLRDPQLKPRAKRLHDSLQALHRTLPAQRDVRIVESWAGAIDVLPDGIPVIDAPAQLPGLLVATGFCGHGFAMGPIVGKVLSDWVTSGDPGFDMHALRLSRYAEGDVQKASSLY